MQQSNWEGPYIVIKRINHLVYPIRKIPRGQFKIVHKNRLAPYEGTNIAEVPVREMKFSVYVDYQEFLSFSVSSGGKK